jgi:hypothetical protein
MTEFDVFKCIVDCVTEKEYMDFSDIGNEIGKKLAEHNPNFANDFINGFKHGVSLTDGTHNV